MGNKLKSLALLKVGFFEVFFVLLVLVLFFGVLNFFNILSLSKIYPNQLGWLPHQQPTAQNQTSGTVTNKQFSTTAGFTKLQNQASDSQMKKYQAFAARFSNPAPQKNSNNYISNAVFSGYNNQTIQVVIKDGILNLNFNQTTLFQKFPTLTTSKNSSTSTEMLSKSIGYSSSQDFFKNVSFGSVLLVFFSKSDLKTTQVNYIESIKPLL